MIRQISLSIFCFVLSTIGLLAQENTLSAAGEASGDLGTVSYSVGQVFYVTNTTENGSETQGVQQPYEISEVTSTEWTENNSVDIVTYPNPVNDILYISVDCDYSCKYEAILYGVKGDVLKTLDIDSPMTSINMESLSPGVYILKIRFDKTTLKIFTISKK